MATSTLVRKRAYGGFTLIEVGIASALLAMLGSGVLLFISDQFRTTSAQASGGALSTLNTAVNQYESQFSANLANHTAVPIPGYGNVANIFAPTTTELYELGFLKTPVPSGVYGIAINPIVVNGTPSGMVWQTRPFTDYQGRPDPALAGAAMLSAGGDAAISTLVNPATVAGVDGWSAVNPQGNTAAILAMRNGAGSAAYLRLDGSTPMQGSLTMNGNNITGANSVTAANVSVAGAVSAGSLATGGNVTAQNAVVAGNYLSSNGNIYAGQNISASGNTSGSTLTATAEGNDVFFGTSALYSDGWNTVIRHNGALYVQNYSGALQPTVTSQIITPAGNGVQVGSTYYYGDGWNSAVRQNGTLYVQNQAGSGPANIDANQVTAEGYMQVNGYASAGGGCGPNGLIGRDGAGHLLSCVNGSWQTGGAAGRYVVDFNYDYCSGTWAIFSDGTTQQIWAPSYECGGGA